MAEDRTTIKLMADQLKKDTATTLERLNILAETNTQLAKDSDPKVSEYYVKGGKDENSYYIKQLFYMSSFIS